MLLFRLTPGLLPSSSPLPLLFKNGAKSNLVFCVVLLISALPLLATPFLFSLTNWKKTFQFFFVVKYLCSDLTLHQFSCLFLDFLVSKIEVSKWCDLKPVSVLVSFTKKDHIQLELLWIFCLGCVFNNENTFWVLENAVCSEILNSWTSFFQSWVSKGQPASNSTFACFYFESWVCYWSCGPRLISATFDVFSLHMHNNEGYK